MGHFGRELNRDTREVCSQDSQWDILNRVRVIHPAEDQALSKTKCPATYEHSVLAEGRRLLNGHPGWQGGMDMPSPREARIVEGGEEQQVKLLEIKYQVAVVTCLSVSLVIRL